MEAFFSGIKKIDFAIIGLTIVTAVIHVVLGSPLLILNGLGYLALLAVLFVPLSQLQPWQRFARWGLIGYTVLTIILYFVAHRGGIWMEDGLGLGTKMVEIILVLLLLVSQQNKD